MGDTFPLWPGRRRWRRKGSGRWLRKACHLSFGFRRRYGFVVLALVAGAALLVELGFLSGGAGRLTTDRNRYVEFREGNRVVQKAVPLNATAVDGDSLRSGTKQIRLLGIDAPELSQTCQDDRGRDWACGREAHALLRSLVARGAVKCVSNAKDRYGRDLAVCSAGVIADIGEAMVRAGFAVNFMDGRYQAAEAQARAEKRGLWRGPFDRPQDWRRRHG